MTQVTENTEKKKVGVTLPPTLHARVKSEAALRGLNVEQAYEQALVQWLEGPPEASVQRFREFMETEPEDEEMRAFQEWLRSVFLPR